MVSQSADSLRASKGVLIRSRLIQGLHHLVDTLTFLRIRETCGLLLSKLKKLQPLRWSEDSHLRSLDPSLAASSARFDFDRFRAGYCFLANITELIKVPTPLQAFPLCKFESSRTEWRERCVCWIYGHPQGGNAASHWPLTWRLTRRTRSKDSPRLVLPRHKVAFGQKTHADAIIAPCNEYAFSGDDDLWKTHRTPTHTRGNHARRQDAAVAKNAPHPYFDVSQWRRQLFEPYSQIACVVKTYDGRASQRVAVVDANGLAKRLTAIA